MIEVNAGDSGKGYQLIRRQEFAVGRGEEGMQVSLFSTDMKRLG